MKKDEWGNSMFKNMYLLLASMFILLLTACTPQTSQTTNNQANSNTLYVGMVNAPVSFNTINSSDAAAVFLEKFMFDSFLEMTAPGEFVPKLAESFETENNKTFTIKINQEANWSDGTPVSAEDVAFTLNMIANPKSETAIGGYLTVLEGLDENGKLPEGVTEIPSVQIIDEKTIQFTTKTTVDENMIKEQIGSKLLILPKHVLGDVAPENLQKDPFMQNPTVTNGPFKYVKYAKDQYVEFVKNEDYYLGEPKLEKLFVKIMPSANLVAQLQTGEIHMNAAGGIGKISVQDYETVSGFENISTTTEKTFNYQNITFNTEKITDKKVRQAIAYAIDRQSIVDKLLQGQAEIVDGPYTSSNPYLNTELELYSYDPEKSKSLLEEANYDFSQTLDLVVPIGNKVREQSADIIAQNLEAVGIKVNITTYDAPTSMSVARSGDFDLILMGISNIVDPDVTNYYSSGAPSNFPKYTNRKVDELLKAGKEEADVENRKEIYNELQSIWQDELPIFTLYSDYDFVAVSESVAVGGPKVLGWHNELYNWALEGME